MMVQSLFGTITKEMSSKKYMSIVMKSGKNTLYEDASLSRQMENTLSLDLSTKKSNFMMWKITLNS